MYAGTLANLGGNLLDAVLRLFKPHQSAAKPLASSSGCTSRRWRFSTMLVSSAWASVNSTMRTGAVSSPASCAAR